MRLLALESGTTSSRAWLMEDGSVLAGGQERVGARDLARGRTVAWLGDKVRSLANTLLERRGLTGEDIDAFVAFGMITSELGLVEVPHVPAPAGIRELVAGLRLYEGDALGDSSDPLASRLYLVPGVRCGGGGASDDRDFMRGEETEVVGLLAHEPPTLPLLFVSPGSHTKFITVDSRQRIVGSITTLSGEMVWALHRETILAELIDPARTAVNMDDARRGATAAQQHGLSRALYLTRLENRLDGTPRERCSDFVLGALAGADLQALPAHGDAPSTVIVRGDDGLARVYESLLRAQPWVEEVQRVDSPLGPMGAWHIYLQSLQSKTAAIQG